MLATTDTSLLPLAEDATYHPPTPLFLQDAPKFVEVYSQPPCAAAASLRPSAEEATDFHVWSGAEFEIHETPALVEV